MSNLTTSLIFVMCVNVLMFMSQAAILSANPDSTTIFYNHTNSMISNFEAGENVIDTSNVGSMLPNAEGSVNPSTGEEYTDIFSTISTWISEKVFFVYNIAAAPYNFLKAANLPNAFVFGVGTLWYVITFFLITSFLLGGGRD